MKLKKILLPIILALITTLSLASCGKSKSANDDKTIKVGATPVPHAEILEAVKPILEKEGYTLEIIEFNDYIQPNVALNDEEILANFFQHTPYMESFAKDKGYNLVSAGKVHVEPLGVYSKSLESLDSIVSGSKVSLPNDSTNHGRALILLHKAGLITLKDPSNLSAYYKNDIQDNPYNLEFIEMEAAMLPRTLEDVSIAVINTNFALDAKLNPLEDALVLEDADSPYSNILTVLQKNIDNVKVQALIKALQSEEISEFIKTKYNGAILPAF